MAEDWLLFTLAAPMASFGGIAVGEVRASDPVPTRSALLGLLGAALGIRRDEGDRISRLGAAVQFAVRVEQAGDCMVDYHTVQAPKRSALKGLPRHRTRRDELSVTKSGLDTVLSAREYHADFRATVAARVLAPMSAVELCDALRRPRFVLYLGRRCNPLAWPLAPQAVQAADLGQALAAQDLAREAQRDRWLQLGREQQRQLRLAGQGWRLAPPWPLPAPRTWLLDFDPALRDLAGDIGSGASRDILRRDEPRDRQQWLFADRTHVRVQGGPR